MNEIGRGRCSYDFDPFTVAYISRQKGTTYGVIFTLKLYLIDSAKFEEVILASYPRSLTLSDSEHRYGSLDLVRSECQGHNGI